MRRGLRAILVLILAAAAGAGVFVAARHQRRVENPPPPARNGMPASSSSAPELDWLQRELALTPEQFEKVAALHKAYRPRCMEMCRRMAEAEEKVSTLSQNSREMTPELAAAISEHARTRAECQQAMATHLYETAAVLTPEQGSRYLEMMMPYALDDAAAASAGEPPSHR